ncbi:hypothetical protein JCM6882_003489 [Rhodosporidiobolus microsporus]
MSSSLNDESQLKYGADSHEVDDTSYGGGERGKDIEVSGGSAYGDGQTEFGGAGRLNDESYGRSGIEGSTRADSNYPNGGEDGSDRSGDLASKERELYP